MTDDVENFKEHYWRRVDAEFAARDARADQFEEAVEGILDCYKDVPLDLQGVVLVSIAKGLVEADPDARVNSMGCSPRRSPRLIPSSLRCSPRC